MAKQSNQQQQKKPRYGLIVWPAVIIAAFAALYFGGKKLKAEDPEAVRAMKANVKKKRQPVFLPGLHMILEICRIFEAEHVLISNTNIREGFLLHCLESTEYKNILTDGQSDV